MLLILCAQEEFNKFYLMASYQSLLSEGVWSTGCLLLFHENEVIVKSIHIFYAFVLKIMPWQC